MGWCVNSRIIRNGHAPDESEYLQRNGTCNSAVYSEFCKILSEGHFLSWWPETFRIWFSSNWQYFKFGKQEVNNPFTHAFIHILIKSDYSVVFWPLWVNWVGLLQGACSIEGRQMWLYQEVQATGLGLAAIKDQQAFPSFMMAFLASKYIGLSLVSQYRGFLSHDFLNSSSNDHMTFKNFNKTQICEYRCARYQICY